MNWVVIENHCYNLNYVKRISWHNGVLSVTLTDQNRPDLIPDIYGLRHSELCELLRHRTGNTEDAPIVKEAMRWTGNE